MPTPTNRTPVRVARGTYSNLNTNKADIQEGEICYATDQDILYVKEGSNLVNASHQDITGKADLAGPTFTGVPAAPTASSGTNTTQIATTAFVTAAVPDISGKANIASPTFTGTVTIPAGASIADIGTTIQAYDADTAKRDTTNTYTALQTMNAGIAIDGPYKQTAEAVGALDISLATGNYFTKTISGNSTFTFSNPPASGTVGSFTLELTHSSGTVSWPDATVSGTSTVKWPADTAPTLTAGKTHLFVFLTDDGGTTYRGAALADYVN
jgi:hypothetical protein